MWLKLKAVGGKFSQTSTLCCPALFTCQHWWITSSPLCFPFFVLFSSVWISSNSTQLHLTLVFWPVLLQDFNTRLTLISACSLWHDRCTRPITKLVPELFVLLLLLMLLLSTSYVQDCLSTSSKITALIANYLIVSIKLYFVGFCTSGLSVLCNDILGNSPKWTLANSQIRRINSHLDLCTN